MTSQFAKHARRHMGSLLREAPTHGPALERWAYAWNRPLGVVGLLEDAVDSLDLAEDVGSYPDAIRLFPLDVLSEAIEAAEALML